MGDLRIIPNKKLRNLISKGPNFREQNNNINWDLCRKLCFEGIDAYKKQWASREKVAQATLHEWAGTVKQLVDKTRLKTHSQNSRKRQTLSNPICKKALETLHEDYVLVPTDKAGNNIIIICKQYYKEVLTRELKNNSGASTSVQCNEPVDKVIQSHLGFMEQHDIDVPEDFIKLPSFYWLPKLHKNPYGHRFITTSSACTTKPLSRTLTHCLKLILKHYKQYCAGIERRTGINCFWVVNNSMEVINSLHTIHRAFSVDSFDFSTLYTKIPHDLLKTRMAKLMDDAFSCRNANTIQISKTNAYWSSSMPDSPTDLTAPQVIRLFNFLIDNIYIQVGSGVFQQAIGILMGTDCAPLIADLFLFSFEFDFMKKLTFLWLGSSIKPLGI